MNKKSFTSGFTLIELLVVITIIAVLSSIGFASFRGTQSKARDSQRKQDLRQLSSALEIYFQKNNAYINPAGVGAGDCTNDMANFYSVIAPFMANQKVPKDPLTGNPYCYMPLNNGQSFRLFAILENSGDKNAVLCSNHNYTVFSQDLTFSCAPGDTALPTPTPSPTTAPTLPPLPTPIFYWAFNQTSGTVANDSAGTNNGTLTSGAYWTAGKLNNAVGFDGSNDNVVSAGNGINPVTADFTAMAWVKTMDSFSAQDIIDQQRRIISEIGRTWLWIGVGKVRSSLGGTDTIGTTNLSSNTWYHLAITKQGSTVTLFVNGQSDGSASRTIEPTTPTGKLIVGINNNTASYPFMGTIDEVKIFSPILTPAQILQIYSAENSTPAPTPIPASPAYKRVFVTNSTFDGNLGGLTGADNKCSTEATALGGTWKAWLSSSTVGVKDPARGFAQAAVPYKSLAGATIANDWNDLTATGNIRTPISLTETLNTIGLLTVYTFTNTTFNGSVRNVSGLCNAGGGDWTDSSFSLSTNTEGNIKSTNSSWTAFGTTLTCNTPVRLYCFEQ